LNCFSSCISQYFSSFCFILDLILILFIAIFLIFFLFEISFDFIPHHFIDRDFINLSFYELKRFNQVALNFFSMSFFTMDFYRYRLSIGVFLSHVGGHGFRMLAQLYTGQLFLIYLLLLPDFLSYYKINYGLTLLSFFSYFFKNTTASLTLIFQVEK